MSADKVDTAPQGVSTVVASDSDKARAPYERPRIEKRRSVARVTLLSGMGNLGVGQTGGMGSMGM